MDLDVRHYLFDRLPRYSMDRRVLEIFAGVGEGGGGDKEGCAARSISRRVFLFSNTLSLFPQPKQRGVRPNNSRFVVSLPLSVSIDFHPNTHAACVGSQVQLLVKVAMSSNNPFKNLAATILDKSGAPIFADMLVPDARKGCKHFENRARVSVRTYSSSSTSSSCRGVFGFPCLLLLTPRVRLSQHF